MEFKFKNNNFFFFHYLYFAPLGQNSKNEDVFNDAKKWTQTIKKIENFFQKQ